MGRRAAHLAIAIAVASAWGEGCGGGAALAPRGDGTDARDTASEMAAAPAAVAANVATPIGGGDAAAPLDAAAEAALDAAADAAADVVRAADAFLDRKSDVPPGVSGACVLHDALTPIPVASHDNDGTGFRRLTIPGVGDIATLQQRCTLDVYRALLPIYCLTGNTGPVTYEVVTYRADGSINETACAADGCGPYSCGTMGACTIRNGNLPTWNAPDVGPGYTRKVFPQAIFFSTLREVCTPEVFAQLTAEYCAMNLPQVEPIQEEIVLYNPDIGLGGDDPTSVWSTQRCVSDTDCPLVTCPIAP
jgi:hypothetical protein